MVHACTAAVVITSSAPTCWYLAVLVNKRLASCSLEKRLFLLAHKLSVFCGHMLDYFLASGVGLHWV